jgi:predicted RND superfamily exporter protein
LTYTRLNLLHDVYPLQANSEEAIANIEARRPLGIAIVGGLVFSQILTLYLTPVLYTYMEEWRKKAGNTGVLQSAKFVNE